MDTCFGCALARPWRLPSMRCRCTWVDHSRHIPPGCALRPSRRWCKDTPETVRRAAIGGAVISRQHGRGLGQKKRPGSLRCPGPREREKKVRSYAPPPPGCLAREYPLPSHGWLKALVLNRRGTENRKPINPLPARTNRANDRKLRCVRASRVAVTMFPWGDEVECEDRPRRRIASGGTVNSLYSLVNTRHNLFSVACCFFRV